MTLGDKIRYLREMEGALRGLDREMTQQEVVRAIRKELHKSISQSYLSQIESSSRRHLTNTTRMLLANFFKVHPGYLVDDPEGFHTKLMSDVRELEERLDLWLIDGAETF
ncbi:MAG TPA: helix-turn-helix transcriptional regulator, partial [Verrucomicrobiaceae bacterium]